MRCSATHETGRQCRKNAEHPGAHKSWSNMHPDSAVEWANSATNHLAKPTRKRAKKEVTPAVVLPVILPSGAPVMADNSTRLKVGDRVRVHAPKRNDDKHEGIIQRVWCRPVGGITAIVLVVVNGKASSPVHVVGELELIDD